MQKFNYTIKDEIGLHARPAGKLSALCKSYESEIVIKKNDKEVNGTKLMMLMSLGIKNGDTVTVEISGSDEERAYKEIKAFFEENL